MITPVMAETLTGELGATGINQTLYSKPYAYCYGWPGACGWLPVDLIMWRDFENSGNLKSLIAINTEAAMLYHFDAGAPAGVSIPVIARIGNETGLLKTGTIIGNGSIGYQRYYNGASPPVETTGGYIYIVMDDWNVGSYSGHQWVYLDYNKSAFYNASWAGSSTFGTGTYPDNGAPQWYKQAGYNLHGNYIFNKNTDTWATYTATKPSGIGISGTINKTRESGVFYYNSRAYILNSTGAVITSQGTSSPSAFNFSVPNEQIKIAILAPGNIWYNSSTLFNITGSVTPTPTPIAGAVYTISTSTDFVNVSGTNTVTIASLTDPSLTDLKYIGAYWSNSTNAGDQGNFYEVGSTVHALSYTLVGGTWYGYDSADVDYNNAKGGIPNPLTLKWDTMSGDKTLHVTLQNSAGDYTYLTRTIHVGQGTTTLIQTRCQAMDGTNGGQLGMVSMQIYNHNTQTWTNLSPNDGLGSVITPPNTILSFYAQKAGFSDGTLLNQPARSDLIYSVNLFTGPAVGSGFVNYFVTVKDAQGFPVGGASIKIINATTNVVYKQGTSSTTGGSQIFNLTASTLYTWTVTKSGYTTRSGSFTTGGSGVSGYLDVVLSPAVTPTKTAAPIPTGSWTVNPSYTPSGNMTGFWTPWVRVYSMMGATSDEIPLLIAGIIIVLCMAAGAGMAGVLGAEVAMGFGAILCVSLGLIPIWVVLAIIILGFLFYGLKIGRG